MSLGVDHDAEPQPESTEFDDSASTLAVDNFFSRTSLPTHLVESLWKRFGLEIDPCDVGMASNVLDLVRRINDLRVDENLIERARSEYFALRYATYDDSSDRRSLGDRSWVTDFNRVVSAASVAIGAADILYVGIGNGRDVPILMPQFGSLIGIDIAATDKQLPTDQRVKVFNLRAEHLAEFGDCEFDLYLSLRTYQSLLLDRTASIREAWRVTRRGGALIVSIPGGFLNRKDGSTEYVRGLHVPGTFNIDESRPERLSCEIAGAATVVGFTGVEVLHWTEDWYVVARKAHA